MNELKTMLQVIDRRILLCALLCCVFAAMRVHADGIGDPIPSFYQEAGISPNRDYENQHAQEHIDPFTGKLQWHYIDLFIPGNGGFDLKVQRSYSSLGDSPPEVTPFGAGWTVHFGRLLTASPFTTCMNGGSAVLELPDGSRQVLYLANAWPSPMNLLSTNYWAGLCTSNGIVVYSPDGTTYQMDVYGPSVPDGNGGYIQLWTRYPSKITDRNGNWMSINYTTINGYVFTPSTVTTSDGRNLTFSYTPLQTKITDDNVRFWQYDLVPASGLPGVTLLSQVTRPDGRTWQYAYNTTPNTPGAYSINQVTYPTGGMLGYTFSFLTPGTGMPRSHVVTAKSISTTPDWTYSYTPATAVWPCTPGNVCPFDYVNHPEQFDVTTVQAPEGTTTYYHFGYNSAQNGDVFLIGSLLVKLMGPQGEGYSYIYAPISLQPNSRPYGAASDATTNAARVIAHHINRNGQEYDTNFSNFDTYGNSGTIDEMGTDHRITTATYFTDPTRWIIHRKQNESTDTIGQITRIIDPNGNVTSEARYGVNTGFTYSPEGDIQTKTNANSNTINYASYKRGIPQSEIHPEGVTIGRTVSDAGNVTSETDGEGATIGYAYDGLNRLISITHPIGNPVSVAWGAITKTVTRGSYQETTNFDGFGRALSVQHAGGAGGTITQTYGYDKAGRRIYASYPNASIGTYFGYDIIGQPIQIIHAFDPASQTGQTQRLYSYAANAVSLTNERSLLFTYSYRGYGDPDHRDLMAVATPVSTANQTFTRNGQGQLNSIAQDSRTRSYGYDASYFLTSATDPEIGTTIYGRDAMGNMTSRKVGSAVATSFGYDGRNRLTSITYPTGTPSVTRGYYKDDKPLFVDNGTARRDYLYNPNKSLTKETLTINSQPFVTQYGYDGNDALLTLTYGSGKTVTYSPDALGWPTQAAPYVTAVTHHPSGQASSLTHANGVQTNIAFNVFNWPNQLKIVNAPGNPSINVTHFNQNYGYDNAGNVTAIADAIDARYSRGMGYDGIDRPTVINGPWGPGTVTFDGHGNIQNMGIGNVTLGYTYDATTDRLTGVIGSKTYSLGYDVYGNVTANGSTTFGYDDASAMRCAKCGKLDQISYDYDGLNQRVRSVQNGLTTYFVHDSTGKLLWEQTPGVGTKEYVYVDGKQVAVRQQTP
jgi:YD repeat-containing protein